MIIQSFNTYIKAKLDHKADLLINKPERVQPIKHASSQEEKTIFEPKVP